MFVLVCEQSLHAQQPSSYFYKGLSYGSEATFNPIAVLLNGGFDEVQAYGVSNSLTDIPWSNANQNLWNNLRSPFSHIRTYGWEEFIRNEILPVSLDRFHMQYFPNYTLHLLGGGMVSRKMTEWYGYHGYPSPALLSAVTSMSYHYINELIETKDFSKSNIDPIADLYIFDPLGILLFSFDGVAEFFAGELSFNDWSSQPAVSFAPFAVRNVSQSFVMKYPLTESKSMSVFYHFGAFGIAGLSFKTSGDESVSLGAGLTSKSVFTYDINDEMIAQTIHVGGMAGVYFDRNNSLMASLVVADNFNERVRFNVFPGLISFLDFSPGFFVSAGGRSLFTVGMTFQSAPFGLSLHAPN